METEWIYKVLHYHSDQIDWVDEISLDELDLIKINDREFHLLKNNQSYHILVDSINLIDKQVVLLVNDHEFRMTIVDPLADLIDTMGLNQTSADHLEDILAPMPGMVLSIAVANGQTIQKGETLIILEAMKMENAIKAPADGIIDQIHVAEKAPVEKGTLLISFR